MSVGRRDGAPARTGAHDQGAKGACGPPAESVNDGGSFDESYERLLLSGVGHFHPADLTSASKHPDLRCEWQSWVDSVEEVVER